MTTWLDERSRNGGVDRIPLPSATGSLHLCGKHFIGPDVAAAIDRTGATTVVCLNERPELAERYPEYVAWLDSAGPDRAVWFPIPDLHAPGVAEVIPLLDDLVGRVARGGHLLVHCGAGIGRAGTLAAALLMRLGVPLADAVDTVAAHRPLAGPEAGSQRRLLEELAAG